MTQPIQVYFLEQYISDSLCCKDSLFLAKEKNIVLFCHNFKDEVNSVQSDRKRKNTSHFFFIANLYSSVSSMSSQAFILFEPNVRLSLQCHYHPKGRGEG